jgi:hypothetical protein
LASEDIPNSTNDVSGMLNNSNATCIPAALDSIPEKIGEKMKICQVCSYEMRRFKWKSVMLCTNHGVRICTEVRQLRSECKLQLCKLDGTPVTDWKWMCETTDSCWNKFHDFYLPEVCLITKFPWDHSKNANSPESYTHRHCIKLNMKL